MIDQSKTHGISVGQIIADKYRITRLVGRGGMAIVVEAIHLQLAKRVALKLVPRGAGASSGFEEARAVASLSSDHAVRVFDCGLHGSFMYVVMELLAGQDLEQYLANVGAVSITEAVEIVLQVSEAIGEAHAHGIIHADLKPSNLFVGQRPDGTRCMKVLDFGIARDHAADHASSTIASGSPGYAAPEQLVPNERIDARADIWALGVILYELISGRRPFEANDLDEALLLALTTNLPFLESPHGPVPRDLGDIVKRCLSPDREERFANIGELVFALSPFVEPDARPYVRRTWAMLRRPSDAAPARKDELVEDRPSQNEAWLIGDVEEDVGRAASAPTKFLVAELAPPRPRSSLLSILTAALMLGALVWLAPQYIPSRRPVTSPTPKTMQASSTPTYVTVISAAGASSKTTDGDHSRAFAWMVDRQLREAAPKMQPPKRPTRRAVAKSARSITHTD